MTTSINKRSCSVVASSTVSTEEPTGFLIRAQVVTKSRMDTKKLSLDNMIEQVERGEYQTKEPAWIRKIMKKKEPSQNQDDQYTQGGGRNGGGGNGNGGGPAVKRRFK